MRGIRRHAWLWAALACWLAGGHASALGADGRGEAARPGQGNFDVPGPCRAGPGADASRLEMWSRVARRPPAGRTDPIRLPVYGWIRFFQRFISPVDGDSCTYYPSCSTYGLRAIERYGLLRGVSMAAERIMRDHHPDNPARYPLVEKGGRSYYWDPVVPRDGGGASGR